LLSRCQKLSLSTGLQKKFCVGFNAIAAAAAAENEIKKRVVDSESGREVKNKRMSEREKGRLRMR